MFRNRFSALEISKVLSVCIAASIMLCGALVQTAKASTCFLPSGTTKCVGIIDVEDEPAPRLEPKEECTERFKEHSNCQLCNNGYYKCGDCEEGYTLTTDGACLKCEAGEVVCGNQCKPEKCSGYTYNDPQAGQNCKPCNDVCSANYGKYKCGEDPSNCMDKGFTLTKAASDACFDKGYARGAQCKLDGTSYDYYKPCTCTAPKVEINGECNTETCTGSETKEDENCWTCTSCTSLSDKTLYTCGKMTTPKTGYKWKNGACHMITCAEYGNDKGATYVSKKASNKCYKSTTSSQADGKQCFEEIVCACPNSGDVKAKTKPDGCYTTRGSQLADGNYCWQNTTPTCTGGKILENCECVTPPPGCTTGFVRQKPSSGCYDTETLSDNTECYKDTTPSCNLTYQTLSKNTTTHQCSCVDHCPEGYVETQANNKCYITETYGTKTCHQATVCSCSNNSWVRAETAPTPCSAEKETLRDGYKCWDVVEDCGGCPTGWSTSVPVTECVESKKVDDVMCYKDVTPQCTGVQKVYQCQCTSCEKLGYVSTENKIDGEEYVPVTTVIGTCWEGGPDICSTFGYVASGDREAGKVYIPVYADGEPSEGIVDSRLENVANLPCYQEISSFECPVQYPYDTWPECRENETVEAKLIDGHKCYRCINKPDPDEECIGVAIDDVWDLWFSPNNACYECEDSCMDKEWVERCPYDKIVDLTEENGTYVLDGKCHDPLKEKCKNMPYCDVLAENLQAQYGENALNCFDLQLCDVKNGSPRCLENTKQKTGDWSVDETTGKCTQCTGLTEAKNPNCWQCHINCLDGSGTPKYVCGQVVKTGWKIVSDGNGYESCVATACPNGYTAGLFSCESGYEYIIEGRSGDLPCGKCEKVNKCGEDAFTKSACIASGYTLTADEVYETDETGEYVLKEEYAGQSCSSMSWCEESGNTISTGVLYSCSKSTYGDAYCSAIGGFLNDNRRHSPCCPTCCEWHPVSQSCGGPHCDTEEYKHQCQHKQVAHGGYDMQKICPKCDCENCSYFMFHNFGCIGGRYMQDIAEEIGLK